MANFGLWRYFFGHVLLLVDWIFWPSSISYSNPLICPVNSETEQHTAEAAYATQALPFEIFLLCMLLEVNKEFMRLRERIEQIMEN